MTVSSYYNSNGRNVPLKYRKLIRSKDDTSIPSLPLPAPKHKFVQQVVFYLPSRLLMRVPGANSPKPNFSRYAPQPEPESRVEYKNGCPSPLKSQTQKDTAISKDPRPPDPAPRKPARRIPRSEIRALYRTLTPAQLEERVQIAKDTLRETMLEYIYSTLKPNSPLPSLMQMRMHPPIARVAQDLDEVDQALKRAREVGQTGLAPTLATGSRTTVVPSLRVTTQRPPAAKKEKKEKTPRERPPPTMIPDPNNPGQLIKRGRGRPRKYPIAPPKDPVVSSTVIETATSELGEPSRKKLKAS